MTSCRFSRWRISAILDFSSLKSPCTTSYRSSIETIALNCLVFLEKITFFVFWRQTDRLTNRQTDRRTDGQHAWNSHDSCFKLDMIHARAWNSLPLETRACCSLLTFRRETKSHIFRQSSVIRLTWRRLLRWSADVCIELCNSLNLYFL